MMVGGSGGGGGDGISSKELAALKEKLKISEDLMAEMSKSWEQKLLETQRIHQVPCTHVHVLSELLSVVYCGLLRCTVFY